MVQEGGGVAWTAPGEPEPCSLSRPSPRAPHMQVLDSPGLQQADDRRPSSLRGRLPSASLDCRDLKGAGASLDAPSDLCSLPATCSRLSPLPSSLPT